MRAQQTQHAPVRLLIAENSENEAHAFDSLLRDAGIPTRTEIVDLAMALQSVTDADLMLANSELPKLQQLLPNLRATAPDVPIILINHEADSMSTTAGLQMGAADVVPKSEPDRLVLVVKRELEKVSQSQRLMETRRALEEAEQRCQLLLDSSMAAIAYVHEGMHISANAGYLELFGFDDSDDLLGLPLIDLLDEASADALKSALKKFRSDGEQVVLDFVGHSTQGDVVKGNMTLAASEYEGEACIQVTIRSREARTADAVPTLLDAAIGTPANGANDTSAGSEQVAADALEASPEANAPQSAAAAIAEPLVSPAHSSADASTLLSVSDFLTAVTAHAESPAEVIFAAEIDAFAALQNAHGISAAEEIARLVTDHLRQKIGARPMTRLSNYQYAFCAGGTHTDSIVNEAEAVGAALASLMLEIGGKTVRAAVSFGGAVLDRTKPGAAEGSLNHAFSTLRAALDQGKRQCVVMRHSEAEQQGEPADTETQVLQLINENIDKQKFLLLFQPIISLRGDSDEHYEVFLRVLNQEGEQTAPNELLRNAADHGVAGKIDRWMILQAIKMLSAHRTGGHNTRLTINLTCNSVTDPEFLQWLGVAIKAARLPSDAVIFQITEQDASSYVRQTREFMEGLAQMHCRGSLSQFGLSAKPFELLDHIPADFVKLDGTEIAKMSEDSELRESITEMIRKLQSAGKLTIVPMVESARVLSALWQAGANYIQGEYLQEPSTEMDYDFSTDH